VSDLFQVDGEGFIQTLTKKSLYDSDNINLHDVFEAYVEMAVASSNACEPNMLRSLIFKQFQKYGDFDQEVQKTAKAVSNIANTTDEVMNAIENDDQEHLKSAYDKLKVYEKDINAINEGILKDEYTGLYNRKYFFTHVLDDELNYKEHGFLFTIIVDEADQIEDLYGAIVLKSILKKFSQMAQNSLKNSGQNIIKYDDNEFLLFSDQKSANDVRSVLKLLKKILEVKKFKITDNKSIEFNFNYEEVPVKTGETFDSPF
jgi:diguanylate cyclase (GGDEF)-like protein